MKYSKYSSAEFLEDADFRQWVLHPDEASEGFWQDFLESYPEKTQEVNHAKNLLLAIKGQAEADFSSQSHEDAVFERIKNQIKPEASRPVGRLMSWPAWAAAASVLFLLGWWFMNRQYPASTLSYETNLKHAERALIEKVNHTGQLMLVRPGDSSTVFLKPNSRISYAENFLALNKREVYLSGEAFFEVTKDPEKPFYVYANELTTKVLGTSFNIKAFDDESDVTVKVSTGRVSVSISNAAGHVKQPQSQDAAEMLLLPNQQAVLSRQEVRLVKSPVEDTAPATDKNRKPLDERFVFAATPAAEVFQALEEAYGLHFEFDQKTFANCQFTANLTEESLYDKLDIICKSIEATYYISDGQVRIGGKGCN